MTSRFSEKERKVVFHKTDDREGSVNKREEEIIIMIEKGGGERCRWGQYRYLHFRLVRRGEMVGEMLAKGELSLLME